MYGSYFVDVHLSNSIVSFEFDNKIEALEIMDLYVEKAYMISFYSYVENPFKYENNTLHPQQPVKDTSLSFRSNSMLYHLYRRDEDAISFYRYRSPVRNYRYFARK